MLSRRTGDFDHNTYTGTQHVTLHGHILDQNSAMPRVASFGVDDYALREKMAAFEAHFTNTVRSRIESLPRTREAWQQNIIREAHLIEEEVRKTEELDALAAETLHRLDVVREALHEAEDTVNEFSRRRDALQMTFDAQQQELAQVETRLREARAAQTRRVADNAQAATELARERKAYEQLLGMRIESAGYDMVRIIFWCVDPQTPSRECSFELDVSSAQPRVLKCDPPLAPAAIDRARAEFAATDNFTNFLKEIRGAFASVNTN